MGMGKGKWKGNREDWFCKLSTNIRIFILAVCFCLFGVLYVNNYVLISHTRSCTLMPSPLAPPSPNRQICENSTWEHNLA